MSIALECIIGQELLDSKPGQKSYVVYEITCRIIHTKEDGIKSIQVIFASHVEPRLVSKQRVFIATEETDIVNNKNISTLNVTQHREMLAIQKHHRL